MDILIEIMRLNALFIRAYWWAYLIVIGVAVAIECVRQRRSK